MQTLSFISLVLSHNSTNAADASGFVKPSSLALPPFKTWLLLTTLLLSVFSAKAQQGSTSSIGKHYFGLQQGYLGNNRVVYNGTLLKIASPLITNTNLVYGRSLTKHFYLETGLNYAFRSSNYTSMPGTGFMYNYLRSEHALTIPINIRYRTLGEKWRFTAGADLASFGFGLYRTTTITQPNISETQRATTEYNAGFRAQLHLKLNAGLEYQIAPDWMFRTDLGIGFNGIRQNTSGFAPSLHFGLFKSIRR